MRYEFPRTRMRGFLNIGHAFAAPQWRIQDFADDGVGRGRSQLYREMKIFWRIRQCSAPVFRPFDDVFPVVQTQDRSPHLPILFVVYDGSPHPQHLPNSCWTDLFPHLLLKGLHCMGCKPGHSSFKSGALTQVGFNVRYWLHCQSFLLELKSF